VKKPDRTVQISYEAAGIRRSIPCPAVRPASTQLAHNIDHFGYKFGYSHQFGLFTQDYAKLLIGLHLQELFIALNFPYLS
jgi:hypothetical protein